ncbi:MAG TPA: hypothetical protein VK168_04860 [Saprospiraceae bacterium]|nr:hypothetical protein [Saprospiraceae bacterium]
MSNIQYPMSKWCACLASAHFWGFSRLNGEWLAGIFAIQANKYPTIVLTPDRRTTWTLDIGYWLLDILHSLFLRHENPNGLSRQYLSQPAG